MLIKWAIVLGLLSLGLSACDGIGGREDHAQDSILSQDRDHDRDDDDRDDHDDNDRDEDNRDKDRDDDDD